MNVNHFNYIFSITRNRSRFQASRERSLCSATQIDDSSHSSFPYFVARLPSRFPSPFPFSVVVASFCPQLLPAFVATERERHRFNLYCYLHSHHPPPSAWIWMRNVDAVCVCVCVDARRFGSLARRNFSEVFVGISGRERSSTSPCYTRNGYVDYVADSWYESAASCSIRAFRRKSGGFSPI